MHIIAGTHRSRRLLPLPDSTIRPTAARTREALFNMLTHRYKVDGTSLLQGARFADICCGSGAIGLEAISRGAIHVTFVDASNRSLTIAKNNADTLKETPKCTFLATDVKQLPVAKTPYDIIFIDPPYDSNLLNTLFEQCARNGWMHGESVIITEQRNGADAVEHVAFELIETRKYGQSVLRFYDYLV